MSNRVFAALSLSAVLSAPGCGDLPFAMGDANSIIVTAAPELWEEIAPSLVPALERTIFTVRDEKTFTVTHQDPGDSTWYSLRLLKQQLLIGTPADPWMAQALANVEALDSLPEITYTQDVWSRGQWVTLVVLNEESGAEAVEEVIPTLADAYDEFYRAWAASKMFASGRNTDLVGTLWNEARFSLLLPNVYVYAVRDSVHLFRNDNPDPSELIRQIAVTWQTPIPEGVRGEDLLAWRARIVDDYYSFPQAIRPALNSAGPTTFKNNDAYFIQGVWENPPGEAFPAAGPFITWAVICRDQARMYLIDAWLYAPGKEKYEYMIQLDEILNSFSCGRP